MGGASHINKLKQGGGPTFKVSILCVTKRQNVGVDRQTIYIVGLLLRDYGTAIHNNIIILLL